MIEGAKASRGPRTYRKAVTVSGCVFLVLSLTAGCNHQTNGLALAPEELSHEKSVEWVTDPESTSSQPQFLRVVLRGDGDFTVVADFPSGSYESPGGRRSERACTWSRVATEPDGSLRVLQSGGGPGIQRVHIEPSDRLFQTSACQPWLKSP
jgi:hypothetical protein